MKDEEVATTLERSQDALVER